MEARFTEGPVRIAYTIDGPAGAPALLLINSIGATRAMWTPQVPVLARRFQVLSYDARGHGQSSIPSGEYALADLGRDAVAVLDHARIPRAHVCGVSLGGLTAMWLGLHAADRVDRLVLAATAARIGTRESWEERMTLLRQGGMTAVADLALPRWLSAPFREAQPDVAVRFRAMVEACPAAGYLGCCAALRDADLRDAVHAITRPVLTIAGTWDATTPPDALADIAARIPGAHSVVLDAAHIVNVEQADAFTAALVAFLDAPA